MRPVIHRSLSITASKEPKLYEHERLYKARRDAADDLYAALERVAAYNFDAPPWQAVEHEVKLIASTALARARGEQSL